MYQNAVQVGSPYVVTTSSVQRTWGGLPQRPFCNQPDCCCFGSWASRTCRPAWHEVGEKKTRLAVNWDSPVPLSSQRFFFSKGFQRLDRPVQCEPPMNLRSSLGAASVLGTNPVERRGRRPSWKCGQSPGRRMHSLQ